MELLFNSPSLISCIRLTTWRAPKSSLAPTAEVALFLAIELSMLPTIRASASSLDDVKAGLAVVVVVVVVLEGNEAWSVLVKSGTSSSS